MDLEAQPISNFQLVKIITDELLFKRAEKEGDIALGTKVPESKLNDIVSEDGRNNFQTKRLSYKEMLAPIEENINPNNKYIKEIRDKNSNEVEFVSREKQMKKGSKDTGIGIFENFE